MKEKILNIFERFEALKKNKMIFDSEAFDRWRNEMSIVDDEIFKKIINDRKMDVSLFSNIVKYNLSDKMLAAYSKKLITKKEYTWFKKIISTEKMNNKEDILEKDEISNNKYISFYFLIYPFVNFVISKLDIKIDGHEESIYEYKNLVLKKQVIDSIIDTYITKISRIMLRISIKEISCRNKKEKENMNHYSAFFYDCYNSIDYLESIYEKYPVTIIDIYNTTNNYCSYISQLFDDIKNDFEELKSTFKIKSKCISNLKMDMGDGHGGGKTVAIIDFDGTKICYKPRNLNVAFSYKNLIDWFNKNSQGKKLKVQNLLVKNDHGYEEFVESKECHSEDEVCSFYRRIGSLIAIVYLLNGNDIHMENIIANGEFPYLIDLETLLQVPLQSTGDNYIDKFNEYMFNRLERTLFLPGVYIINEDGEKGLDFSAITGKGGKLPYKIPVPVDFNTDDFRIEKVEYTVEDNNNRPKLKGNYVANPSKYLEYIKMGFCDAYNVFLTNKKELLDKKHSILNIFNNLNIRILFRSTSNYAMVLDNFYHPDVLEDYLDREKILENMWARKNIPDSIIKLEISDMEEGDVPFFSVDTSTGTMFDSKGVMIKDYKINKIPIEYLFETFEKITPDQRDRLSSVLEYSIGNYHDRKVQSMKNMQIYKRMKSDVDKDEISLKLVKILEHETNTIINNSKFILDKEFWDMLLENEDGSNTVSLTDNSLYAGNSGIKLYLALYYKYLRKDKEKYNYFIQDFKKDLMNIEENIEFDMNKLSINGTIGTLFACKNLLVDEYNFEFNRVYQKVKNKITEKIIDNIEKSKFNLNQFDYINGILGYLFLIINSPKVSERELYLSKLCINILKNSNIFESIGLGHGVSALALLYVKLYSITDDEEYINYAKDLFVGEFEKTKKDINKATWCKGYVGLALSRLEALKDNNPISDEIKEEFLFYMDKIKNIDLPANDCYCHGNSSVMDLFLQCSIILKDNSYLEMAYEVLNMIIANYDKNKSFIIEAESELMDFGLFSGLSGVCYSILRILFIDKNIPTIGII
ncbi:lantibiotic modifying enzyme [Streptococcus pneumoniae]|uniref:type 2 lanthipeptide synthetase LanM n=1 Tax=uncultured Parvimonas sp. TaxID=747372 RepID=UPI0010E041C4|nr:type 2 lanthipeptide synthetase LanM [uncultured Parvimonas sp.]MDS2496795.1 type 2 lanthipeptide synthetase LanM [Streptococcus pneumoniae]MDS5124684.1 type 2 lanthipeptide synthetase LanM [Streptococcus pneumoniae]MDS8957222.1 type 2 lanthipeptide synthetase LanM [Streptococcus pneumoniae]MDT5586641.1 type 2 lanthipeptide synthetase LanM [Streptococcus pneumoniae]MDT5902075.1 type 2 lanthipeptide synthetase LanM [Streptococcus pneumoniae]